MPNLTHSEVPRVSVTGSHGSSSLDYETRPVSHIKAKKGTKKIWPDILRTCRLIHEETSPLLRQSYHTGNRFSFFLSGCGGTIELQDLLTVSHNVFNLSKSQRNWFHLDHSNPFAAFLADLGPETAKAVQHVEFMALNCDDLATNLPLITALCEQHLPGLSSLDVYVYPAEICWNESPDYYHPDRSSPFWMNGEFRPMYEALEHFVARIGWLRRLRYVEGGQLHFGSVDDEAVTGMGLLRRLEVKVEERKGKGVPWIGAQPQVEDAGDEGNRCPVYKSSEATKGKEEDRHRERSEKRGA